jgi:hypothetical protein
MKKVSIILLSTILAFANVASSAENIGELAWNESNIKRLRAVDNAAIFRFSCEVTPECGDVTLSSVDYFDFHWYPAGNKNTSLRSIHRMAPRSVGWTSIGKMHRESLGLRPSKLTGMPARSGTSVRNSPVRSLPISTATVKKS